MSKHNSIEPASVCVVIPVYQRFSDLHAYDVVSLIRCFRVLYNYPIFLAGPVSNDWPGYMQFCTGHGFPFFKTEFSDRFFSGLDGYNELMMSTAFYQSFGAYKYMLICQTDCFVFRDELTEWCAKGYDYIGAPWIGINMQEWFTTPWYPQKLVYAYRLFKNSFTDSAGNGGFSLRKISSMISNLNRFQAAARKWQAQEDAFFSHYVRIFNPFFRIPDTETALRFAFDTYPEKASQLTDGRLPFACHAWFKNEIPHYEHNLSFWEPVIRSYNVQLTGW